MGLGEDLGFGILMEFSYSGWMWHLGPTIIFGKNKRNLSLGLMDKVTAVTAFEKSPLTSAVRCCNNGKDLVATIFDLLPCASS